MEKGLIVHVLLTDDQGRVLIIKRQAHDPVLANHWDIPGGRLEDGEDPTAGAIRETNEETGLDVRDLRLFHHTSNVDVEKDKQFIRLIFRAETSDGAVRLQPDEHDEYRWIDPARPPKLPYVDYLLECLRRLAEV